MKFYQMHWQQHIKNTYIGKQGQILSGRFLAREGCKKSQELHKMSLHKIFLVPSFTQNCILICQ